MKIGDTPPVVSDLTTAEIFVPECRWMLMFTVAELVLDITSKLKFVI